MDAAESGGFEKTDCGGLILAKIGGHVLRKASLVARVYRRERERGKRAKEDGRKVSKRKQRRISVSRHFLRAFVIRVASGYLFTGIRRRGAATVLVRSHHSVVALSLSSKETRLFVVRRRC